jgi:hypothetical protein
VIEMTLQKKGVSDAKKDCTIRITARVIRLGADGVGLAFVLPYDYGSHASKEVDMKTLRRFLQGLKEYEGQALVEFILLLPIVFLLIASTVNRGAGGALSP